jgi:UDP-glucose 4-epimerase
LVHKSSYDVTAAFSTKDSTTMVERVMLVTGGAGFLGSHLTEELLKKSQRVIVLDNFSNGKMENIQHLLNNVSLKLLREDLKRPKKLEQAVSTCDTIFHLAANPEVRVGETDPETHFEENILATFNLLEAIRKQGKPKTLVFTSTSTVYGEARQVPTREDYAPLIPISTYGASKLACEALIASYAHTFNHRALILRLANVIGSRSNHGVIVDFIKKIRVNPRELVILGDGNQEKSYMHISDCIGAITHLTETFEKKGKKVDVFNVGSSDRITVKEIAKTVSKEMHASSIEYRFTGGVEGGRGWKGDVKTMQLSIDKLVKTGWKPNYLSGQAVKLATVALIQENKDS